MIFKESFFTQLKNNEKRKELILAVYRNLLKLAVGFQKYDEIVANYIKLKVIEEFDAQKIEENSKQLLNRYIKAEKSRKELKNALLSFQSKTFEDKNLKMVIMAAYGCRFDDNRFHKYWEKKDMEIYKNLLNVDKKGILFNFPIPYEFSEYISKKLKDEKEAYKCLEEPDFDEFLEF